MRSATLYHGPSSQGRSSEAAASWGRVVGVFGSPLTGLDIAGVREAASAMISTPIGDRSGSVVIGPVDILTSDGIVDILLKTLEERHERNPLPFLWARDAGSVRPTILSRCLLEWCPGVVYFDKAILDAAKEVVDAALEGSIVSVIESMNSVRDSWKDSGVDFLQASVQVLQSKDHPDKLKLWRSIRPVLLKGDPSCDEVLARFLP